MDSLDKKYYKISEVAEILNIPATTLRFWESRFTVIRPRRNSGGTRYYTANDIETIRLVHYLVKQRGLKLDAAQEQVRNNRAGVEKRYEVVKRLLEIRRRLTDIMKALDSRR